MYIKKYKRWLISEINTYGFLIFVFIVYEEDMQFSIFIKIYILQMKRNNYQTFQYFARRSGGFYKGRL